MEKLGQSGLHQEWESMHLLLLEFVQEWAIHLKKLYLTGHPLDDFKKTLQHFTKNELASLNKDLTPFVGREVTVGGVVSSAEARISKNGKRWGTFTLEDYSGSYQFRVFSEEFLKFEHFFKEPNFLYIRFFIKEGYPIGDGSTRGEPRLQFNEVRLLQDVMENLSKKINLHLKAEEVSTENIALLKQKITEHKGNKSVNITLHDKDFQLTLKSRKEKVAITKELLHYLDDQKIPYQLY